MLPGHQRLRRSVEFQSVLRSGARAVTPTVVVHCSTTATGRPPRAGFVVGRSVGGSVVRKRVTRRLRALIAERLAELPDGTDLVVRALPAAAQASPTDLDRDLGSAVRRSAARVGRTGRTPAVVSQ